MAYPARDPDPIPVQQGHRAPPPPEGSFPAHTATGNGGEAHGDAHGDARGDAHGDAHGVATAYHAPLDPAVVGIPSTHEVQALCNKIMWIAVALQPECVRRHVFARLKQSRAQQKWKEEEEGEPHVELEAAEALDTHAGLTMMEVMIFNQKIERANLVHH